MFASRYMPCERCGASLELAEREIHECSIERLLDYTMFSLRHDVGGFEERFHAYLELPLGRFEAWSAAQRVRGLLD